MKLGDEDEVGVLAGPGIWTFPVDSSSRRRGKYTPSLCFLRSHGGPVGSPRGVEAGGLESGLRHPPPSGVVRATDKAAGGLVPRPLAGPWASCWPRPPPTPGLPLKGLEMGHLGARRGSLRRVELGPGGSRQEGGGGAPDEGARSPDAMGQRLWRGGSHGHVGQI